MSFTTYWLPNQSAIAQVETYTFTAPGSIGNTYVATINGKSITYTSVSGDTAATAATALLALLQASTIPELSEITFANPSDGVLTATASTPGTPFANVPGTSDGLVLSTGNGLVNGITTVHTQANKSPSDINDAQNWMRYNMSTTPPAKSRALPQNGDNVVLANSTVPMLWNLDQLKLIQFNTFQRWLSMTGQIGLPETNSNGYTEWRAKHFWFDGPQGSVPSGGLDMVIGYNDGSNGSSPPLERYNVQSSKATLTVLYANQIDFLGVHTQNSFTALNSSTLNIASNPGEISNLNSSTNAGATVSIGSGVTWTSGSTFTVRGGTVLMGSAPSTQLDLYNNAQAVFLTDALTWANIQAQGNCTLTWLCGGTVTTLVMSNGCTLDKSGDARSLTITNSTIDGDTCQFIDPLNAITWTNATTVKQQSLSGPFQFTGQRTVKVT